MSNVTSETKKIINIFQEIVKIPRCSGNEKSIAKWIMNFAEERGCEVHQDEVGNVLVKVEASKNQTNVDPICLQAHMDMVCQKQDTLEFDFQKDSIETYEEAGWLKAKGTTLGADNGLGIAMMLNLLDSQVEHPPLELLFTVDEEVGLEGANKLSEDWLHSQQLINLDSEDEGVFTIGCAGGIRTSIGKDFGTAEISKDWQVVEIKVQNGRGGHSGVDIDKGRANAIMILARVLNNINQELDIRLISVSGGSVVNAIPRDAVAKVLIKRGSDDALESRIDQLGNFISNEYDSTDSDLDISGVSGDESVDLALTENGTRNLIELLFSLPNGVFSMSQAVEGLVETSTNVGIVSLDDGKFELEMMQRGSVESKMNYLTSKIECIARLGDFKVENKDPYPGWEPNRNSGLLNTCKKVYKELFDKEPIVEVIHAGLECGVIVDKYENMDMISFGPTIKNAHSPDEKAYIDSIGKVWRLLVEVLVD